MYDLLLAKIEIELKWELKPFETKALFRELYEELEGKKPTKKINLLTWFYENYRYDGHGGWSPKCKYH